MILEIVCLVIGAIVFLIGLLRFQKEKNDVKARRGYGLISYLGFTVMLIAGIMLLGSLLSGVNSFVLILIILVILSAAGRYLLDSGNRRK